MAKRADTKKPKTNKPSPGAVASAPSRRHRRQGPGTDERPLGSGAHVRGGALAPFAFPEISQALRARAWSDVANPRQRAFLAAFSVCGSLTRAEIASAVSRRSHSNWLRDDPQYAEAFGEAKDIAADFLEDEARRRAVDGLVRYRFTKGGAPLRHPVTRQPYFEIQYSDTLLALLLAANKPEKFRRRTEVTGKDGGPIELTPTNPRPLAGLSDEELVALEAAAAKPEIERVPAEQLVVSLAERVCGGGHTRSEVSHRSQDAAA